MAVSACRSPERGPSLTAAARRREGEGERNGTERNSGAGRQERGVVRLGVPRGVNAKKFATESCQFEVLNEVYLQNFLHECAVNCETNLMSLLNP